MWIMRQCGLLIHIVVIHIFRVHIVVSPKVKVTILTIKICFDLHPSGTKAKRGSGGVKTGA